MTPALLKDWFHKLTIGVNLGNTRTKEALVNRVIKHLAQEVDCLSTGLQAAQQHVASMQSAAAAAAGAPPPPSFFEAHVPPAARFQMPLFGGLPPVMPQLPQWAAAMGFPLLGDAAGAGLQFAPFSLGSGLFQGTQPSSF